MSSNKITYPPSYRLRLFLSVDLAGSTAFKLGRGSEPVNGNSSQATWVQVTRDFYQKFPRFIEQYYATLASSQPGTPELLGKHPVVWKTLGDEILFCNKIISLLHLSICAEAFLMALGAFGSILDRDGGFLDVKGAGWTAAFPAPNVTVSLGDARLTADQFDEAFESGADNNPREVDFLGNGIDCGFRISSKASSDRFVLSVELAWLLTEAAFRGQFKREFSYHDRHILKGVLKDRPYPIVSIPTERSPLRRQVRVYERQILREEHVEPLNLRNFLEHFMRDEEIDLPFLAGEGSPLPHCPPEKYNTFIEKWLVEAADIERLAKMEADSESVAAAEGDDLPQSLIQEAEATIELSKNTMD